MDQAEQEFDFVAGEILLFNKALDWTSFDLVRKIRNTLSRHVGVKRLKVGHAGTLDPKATGLMILCTGKATKQIDALQAQEKEYVATLKLGATCPSFDLETQEDVWFPTEHITTELISETLPQFFGETEQVPPVFSAIRIDGKRAYEHARKGNDIEMKPRKIFIKEMELIRFEGNELVIRVVCSKGTYIRSLARDLGLALNSGAYLIGLERTRIGDFRLENAFEPEIFLKKFQKNVTN